MEFDRNFGRTIIMDAIPLDSFQSILVRPLCVYFQQGIWLMDPREHLKTKHTNLVCDALQIELLCCSASCRTLHSQRSMFLIAPFSIRPDDVASYYANLSSNAGHDGLYHVPQTPKHAVCLSSFAKLN